MKLVFFSGGDYKQNKTLNQEMIGMTGVRDVSELVMVYVPSFNNEHEGYFMDWKRFYRTLGIKKFLYLPLRKNVSQAQIDRVFEADIIFFSGGNTFSFLNNMRRSGLRQRFKRFIDRGGVLAGMSAGAIMMTPTIKMAQIPSFDQDPNDDRVIDLRALNLVPFEFSPHYERANKRLDDEILAYSTTRSTPIYCCEDGTGLVVQNGKLYHHGAVTVFHQGNKFELNHL